MATTVLCALKKKYGFNCQLDFAVDAECSEVLSGDNRISKIYSLPKYWRKKASIFRKFLYGISRFRSYDLIVCLDARLSIIVPIFFVNKNIYSFMQGWRAIFQCNKISETDLFKGCNRKIGLFLAAALGGEDKGDIARDLCIPNIYKSGLSISTHSDSSKKILFCPGGGRNFGEIKSGKIIPSDIFLNLIERFSSQEVEFIAVGDEFDRSYAEYLVSSGASLSNFCGLTSWSQLEQMLITSALFIGPDSGTLHLAVALGRPTIGLYKVTASEDFGYNNARNVSVLLQGGENNFTDDINLISSYIGNFLNEK